MTERGRDEADATLQYKKIVEGQVDPYFPRLRPEDGDESPLFQRFRDQRQDQVHLSIALRSSVVPGGLTSEVLALAIEHGTTQDDPAYSQHAMEHQLAPKAARRVVELLRSDPGQVSVQVQFDNIYQTGNPREDMKYETYVLSAAAAELIINRPLYIEVADQLKVVMAEVRGERPTRQSLAQATSQRNRILRALAKHIGGDFATLVAVSIGMDVQPIRQLFRDFNIGKVGPTPSRDSDFDVILKLIKVLFPFGYLTFNKKRQLAAIDQVSNLAGWTHATDSAWSFTDSPHMAQPIIVLGSKAFALARAVTELTPNFRNPAKQKWLDQAATDPRLATTELITAYMRLTPRFTEDLLVLDGSTDPHNPTLPNLLRHME